MRAVELISYRGLVVAYLAAVEQDLIAGSIVVLGEGFVRIRRLPIL